MAIEKNNVIIVEHEFQVSVEKVFAAIKAGRLFYNCGAWPSESKIDFRVGGEYCLDWAHYGNGRGKFTEIVENKRVAFTWAFGDESPSQVTIDLVASGKGCKAKLRHDGFAPDAEIEGFNDGWTSGMKDFANELGERRLKIDREFLVPVEMLYDSCSGLNFFANMGATKANSTIDFRVGGRYECKLETGNTIRGEFREIVKGKKIVFTWEAAPCGEPVNNSTTVTMEFGPWGDDGKNSYLELTHTGFDSDEATCAHHAGWSSILRKIYDRASK